LHAISSVRYVASERLRLNMDIFDYLKEEQEMVRKSLKDLVDDFSETTREKLFDDVKAALDKLRGYCKKQSVLLVEEIGALKGLASFEATKQKRVKLLEDLDNLVMVHVDEPGYKEYLMHLLSFAEEYFEASAKLYEELTDRLPKELHDKINQNLQTVIHSDVGFNSLQTADMHTGSQAKKL
jgi:hypothetical protein